MARQPVPTFPGQPPLDQPYAPAGGLALPRDVGTAQSVADAAESRWGSTIARVNERLRAQGFYEVQMPDIQCPEVTTEALLTTDVRTYTVVYEGLLRWLNYTSVLYAHVRATLLGVENEMDSIASKKRIGLRAFNRALEKAEKKDIVNAEEMEDIINEDVIYSDLKLQKQELLQSKIELEARVEALERGLRVVSRQVEIRKAESLGGNRVQNMPNPNAYPGPQQGSWGPGR